MLKGLLLLLFNITFIILLCFSQPQFKINSAVNPHVLQPSAFNSIKATDAQGSNIKSIKKGKNKMPASADYLVNTYYAESENLHPIIYNNETDAQSKLLEKIEQLHLYINKVKSKYLNIESRLKKLEQRKN